MGVDKPPVVEPQTSPEVVHEHRETGHNGKYTPWTTELITMMRCEGVERTQKGFSNIRVVFIELLVPPLTLIGDFDEAIIFGRRDRPLTHGGRITHGRRYSGGEEEKGHLRPVRDRTTSSLLIDSDVFDSVSHPRIQLCDANRLVMSEINVLSLTAST